MEITKNDISKLRPKNNYVLIQLDRSQDELTMEGGTKLFLDTSYEEEKHAPVTGFVYALPEKLIYNRKDPNSLQWKTELELELGDYVICYFMSSVNALDQKFKKMITCEGVQYIFVRYENIFIAKRKIGKHTNHKVMQSIVENGYALEVIPINGNVICEKLNDEKYLAMERQAKAVGLELPNMIKQKYSGKYVVVRYVGKPNQEYKEKRFSDENCDVQPGDVVTIRKLSDIPLEYDLHATFEGRKSFVRIQRKFITGIVTNDKWKATLQTEILAN